MRPELLAMLQCPLTGQRLRLRDKILVSEDGALDRAVLKVAAGEQMEAVAEICCGVGEAFRLFNGSVRLGIGVDVSQAMLETARHEIPDEARLFANGDAMRLPLRDGQFDMVVMRGGVHHVNDRDRLFAEVRRILKPRGVLVCREPLDDFFWQRMLRSIVYKASSTLESRTERPLRRRDTQASLERAGFTLETWRTMGFLGYCFLMNRDVLAVNRIWQYIPNATVLTSVAAKIDEWTLRLPYLSGAGLAVVGRARRAN